MQPHFSLILVSPLDCESVSQKVDAIFFIKARRFMKRSLLIFIFLLFGWITFSQDIVSYEISACGRFSHVEYRHENRLIDKSFVRDTLHLKLGVVRNCHFDPKLSVTCKPDSLLLDLRNTSELFAACQCYYEIRIDIVEIKDTNFNLYCLADQIQFSEKGMEELVEIKEIFPFSNKYIFPKPSEIALSEPKNQYNAEGLTIGIWQINTDNQDKIDLAFYEEDSTGEVYVKWYARLDLEGNIEQVCAHDQDQKNISTCISGEDYLQLMAEEEK